jgi:transposase InsO family protein
LRRRLHFRGAVFEIGRVAGGTVELYPKPTLLYTINGFKLESIARRRHRRRELWGHDAPAAAAVRGLRRLVEAPSD